MRRKHSDDRDDHAADFEINFGATDGRENRGPSSADHLHASDQHRGACVKAVLLSGAD